MITKPQNYEEAKTIIQDSVNHPYNKKFAKSLIRRAILNVLGGLAFGAIIGWATGSSLGFLCFLPCVILVLVLSVVPIIMHYHMNRDILSGRIFQKKSRQEIIDLAGNYVDQINEYEMKT